MCPRCKKIYSDKLNYCISCGIELVSNDCKDECEIVPVSAVIPKKTKAVSRKQDNNEQIKDEILIPIQKKKRAKITPRAVAKNAGAFVIAALIFAAAFSAAGTYSGRVLTDQSTVDKAVAGADLLSIPASEFGLNETPRYKMSESATLSEAVTVMAAGTGLDDNGIRAIFEASTIKGLVIDTAKDYAEYVRTGRQPRKITAATLKEKLDENTALISETVGMELTEHEKAAAYEEIEALDVQLEGISAAELEKSELGGYIRIARAFISVPFFTAELVFAAVMAVVLAVVCKNGAKTLAFSGWALLSAGITFAAAVFMFTMQLGYARTDNAFISEMMRCFSAVTAERLYGAGGMLIFVGAAALIWSAAVKKGKALKH